MLTSLLLQTAVRKTDFTFNIIKSIMELNCSQQYDVFALTSNLKGKRRTALYRRQQYDSRGWAAISQERAARKS